MVSLIIEFMVVLTVFFSYIKIEALNATTETLRETIEHLIDLSMWSYKQEYAKDTLPFVLMEDIFDLLTIGQCAKSMIFSIDVFRGFWIFY